MHFSIVSKPESHPLLLPTTPPMCFAGAFPEISTLDIIPEKTAPFFTAPATPPILTYSVSPGSDIFPLTERFFTVPPETVPKSPKLSCETVRFIFFISLPFPSNVPLNGVLAEFPITTRVVQLQSMSFVRIAFRLLFPLFTRRANPERSSGVPIWYTSSVISGEYSYLQSVHMPSVPNVCSNVSFSNSIILPLEFLS